MSARVKYFFDTEFVETGDRLIPVSIGIVSESGREYYAEVDNDWRVHASPWICENVLPHLEGANKPVAVIREELLQFVGAMPCEFWAYFASSDWVVLCQLMGYLSNLPNHWQRFVMDLAWLDPGRAKIRALPVYNPKPHHALWDARELKQRYELLIGDVEVQRRVG